MVKTSLFVVVLIIITSKILAQTPLGIGLVRIRFDKHLKLNFYSDTTNVEPVKTLQFYYDTNIDATSIKNLDRQLHWLKPESFWLDYHIMVFRVVSQTGRWFKVVVNNENGRSYWIKRTNKTEFQSWESYLKGMVSVARLPQFPQKIRSKPDDHAPVIEYQGQDCFVVKSVRGDWLEIATSGICDETTMQIKSGWIRWRKGNRLLIEYFPTC